MKRLLLLSLIGGLALPSFVRADSLWISSGGAPVEWKNVKVQKVENGQIFYRTATGSDNNRKLDQVVRLQIDDEPGFNQAEQAYLDQKWKEATDGYEKALRVSDKAWLKDRSAARLIETSQKVNRVDMAMTAYIHLLSSDPKSSEGLRPNLTAGATGLDTAITDVKKALGNAKLDTERRIALLSLQLDLYRAKGDNKGASDTVEALLRYDKELSANPAAMGTLAELTLSIAKLSLDQKQYAKAISDIESRKASFTDPAKQAEALFIIAEAKAGLDAEQTDANKLKDLALNYMRVVAIAKDNSTASIKFASLYKAGEIMEKLKEKKEALSLFQEVAKTENAYAARAKEAVARVSK